MIEDFQEEYDKLNEVRKEYNTLITEVKAKAKKAGYIFQSGKFLENEKVLCIVHSVAEVDRYVGEKGTLYNGSVFCTEVHEEIKDDIKLMMEAFKDFVPTLDRWKQPESFYKIFDKIAWKNDSSQQYLQDECGYPYLDKMNVKDVSGDDDIVFEFEAKGNDVGQDGQIHDNSVVRFCYRDKSWIHNFREKTIDNEFDVWLTKI